MPSGLASKVSRQAGLLLVVLVRFGWAAEPVAITDCGNYVTARDAYLANDLDCSGYTLGPPIALAKRSTLELRGFTIIGPPKPHAVVFCHKPCTVVGAGGTIVGGIVGVGGENRVAVYDANFVGQHRRAVAAPRVVRVEGITVRDVAWEAITSGSRLVIRNSLISDCGGHPDPETGEVRRSSAVIYANHIRVEDSIIRGSAWGGVEADGPLRIVRSAVTNNGMHPTCGIDWACNFDVASRGRLRIEETECGRSFDLEACPYPGCDGGDPFGPETDPSVFNFGVCTLD